MLISASSDRTIRVWDLNTAKERKLTGHTSFALSCDINFSDSMLAVGFNSHDIRLWNLA
jgi:WD40 repeat protein